MNKENIIKLAREAGFITSYGGRETASDELLERFAALVAAAEREQCAKALEAISNAPDIQAYAAAIRNRSKQ